MSHYRNVDTILALSEKYDLETLMEVFETSDLEVLVDDVAYIVTKLLAHFSEAEKKKVLHQLRTEITNHDFKEFEDDLTPDVP